MRREESVPSARFRRLYGANLTLIASLSVQGMGEAMLLDGSADAAAFETYIEQILAPSLRLGQIVIGVQSLDSSGTSGEAGHRRKILPTPVSAGVLARFFPD